MKEFKELQSQLERQKKIIGELQEKINFLKFDISQLNRENKELRIKLKSRTENIKNVRVELMSMKRQNNFSRINNVLLMLNAGWENEYESNSNN
jgi:chromosome segregation ATPase